MSRPVRVVPAILTEDPVALRAMTRQAKTFCDYVQYDIMDGVFVPSNSISAGDIAAVNPGLNWEAHLMVRQPENYFAGFEKAGAKRVIFHLEAADKPEGVIETARSLKIGVGAAVNPETSVSRLIPLIEKIDCVLFMSVNPGFYGSPFIPEVLDKVAELRRRFPDAEIGMDGGINDKNIRLAASSGADYVCIGSAVFRQADPPASYRRLVKLANEGG